MKHGSKKILRHQPWNPYAAKKVEARVRVERGMARAPSETMFEFRIDTLFVVLCSFHKVLTRLGLIIDSSWLSSHLEGVLIY